MRRAMWGTGSNCLLTIAQKNKHDDYFKYVFIITFDTARYDLEDESNILQLLRETAEFLHSYTFARHTGLLRGDNRTDYIVDPHTFSETKNPLRKLDSVVTLQEAISIVRTKYRNVLSAATDSTIKTIVNTYFTEPIENTVWEEINRPNIYSQKYNFPQHNIRN